MLKNFLTSACALALLTGMVGNAFAATIASVIQTDGSLSRLSDNSLEALWNSGQPYPNIGAGFGDTTVDVGDRLLAIGRIDQVSSPFPSPDKLFGTPPWTEEFTFVSVIQVASVVPNGTRFDYTFVPSSVADPLGLGWQANTMIAFYSDPANNYSGSPASIIDGITRSSGGTAWWELGAGPGYTWTANTATTDISVLAGLPPGTSGGSFNFQLDLVAQNGGLGLIPVVGSLEMTGSGNLVGPPPSGGYQTIDNYDAFIRAVPEPGSMAVFGLLGAAAFARARRNKNKK